MSILVPRTRMTTSWRRCNARSWPMTSTRRSSPESPSSLPPARWWRASLAGWSTVRARLVIARSCTTRVNPRWSQRLGRTEFMPFAPATLYEHRHQCYRNVDGGDYAAQFMTVTFDCTEFMKQESPAAVHVDGTARPQLVTATSNPSFHQVLTEYHRLTGLPSVINTSFNMHEEPIVCSPDDAVRAFLQGNLDYLAIGSFLVAHPSLR